MPGLKFQCRHCAQPIEAPLEAAGMTFACPCCTLSIEVPLAPAVENSRSGNCPFCMTSVRPGDEQTACPSCQTPYHADCWTENGGCGVYGCSQVPVVENRRAIELPMSYWGRENKPCPSCGQEILAAAVRCRHCGATFDSARPEEANEFQERTAREQRLPGVRKTVVWLFFFCVLPCLAPIGAIWGAIWYPANRHDVRALPSLYPALCKIGLAVAAFQVTAMIVVAGLYAAFRAR